MEGVCSLGASKAADPASREITAVCMPEDDAGCPEEQPEVCWICLDTASAERPLLRQSCRCPRVTHPACRARWQLQSAGSTRETNCEFCGEKLPDWRAVLTPPEGAAAPSVMNVHFDGKTYSFEVQPGEDGYNSFTASIRQAFGLPDASELNITFTCDEPVSGSLLTLRGAGAFDAAVHCAAVSAVKRRLTAQPLHAVDGPAGALTGPGAVTAAAPQQQADRPHAFGPPAHRPAVSPRRQQQDQHDGAEDRAGTGGWWRSLWKWQ